MRRFEDNSWKEKMRIRFDYNNMMSDMIGDEWGINKDQITALIPKIRDAVDKLNHKRKAGKTQWRDLPYIQKDVVKDILAAADEVRQKYETFVLLGIGGSALGPIAVHQALNHLHYNELPREKRGGPRFYVVDNIDPERIQALFDVVDIKNTVFNVVTKSGNTSETMAQFLIVRNMLKEAIGEKYRERIIATTDAEKGSLIKIAREEGYRTFFIPAGVGGRFSELSPVGLLPAAVGGIDIEELLAGAAYMDELCSEDDVFKNPAYMAAVLQYIAMQQGKNISVMTSYADSLKYMADWYAQLWAESLGKKLDLDGKEVYAGQTPVKALGATDQHSQIQLYTEGPFDKVITFITVEKYRSKVCIPRAYEDMTGVSFLGGHTINRLIRAEQMATEYALYKAKRMNRTIILPEVNAFTIGQLLYMLEVETAFIAELLNINAFDQPGVEEGKIAAYALMGRPGYERKKAELESGTEKKMEYII
jgi:glucose-6-phosphate isomerase